MFTTPACPPRADTGSTGAALRHTRSEDMRSILFAAALSISGIAYAQTQGTSDQPATEDAQPSGGKGDDPPQATGPQGVPQQGTDPQGQATAPAGTNQMAEPAPGGTIAAP